jgi:hypothetical protein
MILAPHIPKTGGCTFLQVLKKVFGFQLFHHNRWKDQSLTLPGRMLSQWTGRQGLVPAWTRCIFGHFPLPHYAKHFPDATCITWLREPAERVASEYYYLKRHFTAQGKPDFHNRNAYQLLIERQISLAEWVQLPQMKNVQCAFLGNRPIQEFAFVGITEDYEASIDLFLRMYSRRRRLAYVAQNTNPERRGRGYDINGDVRNLIRARNADDARLYDAGVEHYLRLCRQYGVTTTVAKPVQFRLAA